MRTLLAILFACIFLTSCATQQGPATKLDKANVLPLAIDDHFEFRKMKLFYNQANAPQVNTQSETIAFERMRMDFGTVTSFDRQQRQGNYFSFFWRTSQEADVTVRLEYRQAALGNYVMAQERYYPGARGSFQSDFEVIGDDYLENGRVTSWRALLIVEGKIVAMRQSYIWR